jgi:hypothetical protein
MSKENILKIINKIESNMYIISRIINNSDNISIKKFKLLLIIENDIKILKQILKDNYLDK